MSELEYWILRMADSDLTWYGFGWLRPAKDHQIGLGFILISSVLLGLPGIGLGAGAVYYFFGTIEAWVWPALFSLAMAVEIPIHLVFAHYWNRRAREIAAESGE